MSEQGCAVIVTGAASGIGLAVVEQLIGTGRPVVALDRRACSVPGVRTVICDLADETSLAEAVDQLPAQVAGLANVAGVPGTLDPETVLTVNLVAPRLLTESLLARLAPGAAVVNVSSVAAHRCLLPDADIRRLLDARGTDDLGTWLSTHQLTGPATYDVSKRALNEWTRALAASLVPTGRRALTVSPGPVETPILGDFRTSMGADAIARAEQTVGRHGRPEEVAAVIAFALSQAASWVNGIDIPVEGGLGAVRASLADEAFRVSASEQGAPA